MAENTEKNGNGNNNGNGNFAIPIPILNRIFNISSFEWPRVTECWFITFFFKIGSAVGWTVLTAAFVSQFGISFLPLLFVINALFIMLGTYFFEQYTRRIKRETLMIVMLIMGMICLFFASFLYEKSTPAFFALIIFAESVFLAQFNVFIPILVGDRFTPLESQRTFPLVESGETIGGMLGGAMVGLFAAQFPIAWFIYVWITALLVAIVTFIVADLLKRHVPPLPFRARSAEATAPKDEIKLIFQSIKRLPFLKGLIVIILFQWIFMNILEFQYTKALEQSVTKHFEPTIAYENPEIFRASVLSSSEGVNDLSDIPPRKTPYRALSYAEQTELTRKLGLWKGVFSAAALFVQALIASRIITGLGIVGSLLLHPILMLMSLVGMFLKFGFLSTVAARTNFEITNVVHENAYFASHYAFPKFVRDQAAQFLEGMVRPMGTVIGMIFVLSFQFFLFGRDLSMVIHILMTIIMLIVLIETIRLQPKYTAISRDQLFSQSPYPEKLNAIEILAQRGHDKAPFILVQKLRESLNGGRANDPPLVRVKLLTALGKYRNYHSLPTILESLHDPDSEVRLEAAHALMNFSDIGEKFYTQAFSRYRLVETLKDVFRKEKSASVRKAIIRVFSILHQTDIIPFLIEVLNEKDETMRADCIYTLGLFRDPMSAYYIYPALRDNDALVRANAVISMWQFPTHRREAEETLNSLLESSNRSEFKAGLFALGEIGLPRKRVLMDSLQAPDPEIRLEAAFALTKCADPNGFQILLDHFLKLPAGEFEIFRRFFHRLKPQAKKMVDKILLNVISNFHREIFTKHAETGIEEMEQDLLERLRRLYGLLDQHEELYTIEQVINHKLKSAVSTT